MNQYLIKQTICNKIENLVNECLSGTSEDERKDLLTLMKISRLGAGDYFLRHFFDTRYQYSICIDEAVKSVLEFNGVVFGCFEKAKEMQSKLDEYLEDKIPKDNDYFNSLPSCLKDTIRNYYYHTPEFLNMKKEIRAHVKKAFSGLITDSIERWYIDHNEWSEGE